MSEASDPIAERRFRRVPVDLSTAPSDVMHRVPEGCPEGTRVLWQEAVPELHAYLVTVCHESFDPVPLGRPIPEPSQP